jgi:hypothetical protein
MRLFIKSIDIEEKDKLKKDYKKDAKKFKTEGGEWKKPPKGEKEKQEMASEVIRYHHHQPEKFPGGHKQMIAVGLKQAGASKYDDAKKALDELSALAKEKDIDKKVSKAITSMTGPRPTRFRIEDNGGKDTFDSASRPVTQKLSRLRPSQEMISEDQMFSDVTGQNFNKGCDNGCTRCNFCGRVFGKSFNECPTCSISKAQVCKGCGKHMTKNLDGSLICRSCS